MFNRNSQKFRMGKLLKKKKLGHIGKIVGRQISMEQGAINLI